MGQLKLLVVDDEEGIVFFIKKIFSKRGIATFGATDGIKAVELFERERPDITFIDIHMPYSPFDGVEVLRRIKQLDKDAYCVMITRLYDTETIDKTKELGARHYITKPFEIEDLEKCVNEVQPKG